MTAVFPQSSSGPLFDKSASGVTVGGALEWAVKELSRFSPEEARVEARMLLSGFLEKPPTWLHLNRDQELAAETHEKYLAGVRRRNTFEPAAYILGKANFRGLDFSVTPDVLIPRPETELVVEKALEILRARAEESPAVLDVGTGSGCVAVSLALDHRRVRVWASDLSAAALNVAAANAARLNVSDRLYVFQSDLYRDCGPKWKGYFDMIVSNPPYISSSKLSQLDPDLGFEPREALDGGPLGLTVIEKLVEGAGAYLKDNGVLVLEIGFDQGESVRTIFSLAGFKKIEILKDFNRHDRIAVGRRNGTI